MIWFKKANSCLRGIAGVGDESTTFGVSLSKSEGSQQTFERTLICLFGKSIDIER